MGNYHLKVLSAAFNVFIVALCLGAVDCGAEEEATATAPQQFSLDNGLCVLFQPNAHTPTVALSASVGVPASRESRLTAGIRYLLATMVGCPQVMPNAASEPPTALQIDSAATRDHVELLVQCLPQDFPSALRLVRQQLFELQLGPDKFEAARQETLTAIQASRRRPVALARSTIVEELYPQQPGSWPVHGSIASMSVITLEQVQRLYQDSFWPNAAVLSISGDLPVAEVTAQVQSCFGDLLPGKVAHSPERFSPHAALEAPRRLIMRGVDSSVVVIAGRAPTLADSDYPAAAVLSVLLGSGMGSRLFLTLRGEQSLAYTIEGALTPSRVCSYAYVLATCSARNIEATQTEIHRQLRSIIRDGVSEAELERAKRFVTNRFMLSKQRNPDLAHYLAVFYGTGGAEGLETYQQFPARVAEVSAEQAQQICAKIFTKPATIIVEGDTQPAADPSLMNWDGQLRRPARACLRGRQ